MRKNLDVPLVVGTLGAVVCLVGFIRVSTGAWGGDSFLYEVDNLIGSSLLAAYAITKRAYPNIVLNLIWAGTALFALEHSYF